MLVLFIPTLFFALLPAGIISTYIVQLCIHVFVISITVFVVVVDLIMFITITMSHVCATVHVHVCVHFTDGTKCHSLLG